MSLPDLRKRILGARSRLKREPADLGDFADLLTEGEALYVQEMDTGTRNEYEGSGLSWRQEKKGMTASANYQLRRETVLVRVLVLENGARVFRDEDAQHLTALPASLTDRLFEQALRLSRLLVEEDGPRKNGCLTIHDDVPPSGSAES